MIAAIARNNSATISANANSMYNEYSHEDVGCAIAGTTVIGGAVANHIRLTLEIGPKGKQVVAVAPD